MVIIPIASLPIEFIRKQVVQSGPNAATSDEITLPTSLRANSGYTVFLYAWEIEIESALDLFADLDEWKVTLSKTDPSTTEICYRNKFMPSSLFYLSPDFDPNLVADTSMIALIIPKMLAMSGRNTPTNGRK